MSEWSERRSQVEQRPSGARGLSEPSPGSEVICMKCKSYFLRETKLGVNNSLEHTKKRQTSTRARPKQTNKKKRLHANWPLDCVAPY